MPIDETSANLAVTSSERRRARLEEEIRLSIEDTLAPWEDLFCQWVAKSPGRKSKLHIEVASILAGTQLAKSDIRWLKYRPAWRKRFAELKGTQAAEQAIAREIHENNQIKAAELATNVLGVLQRELGKTGDDANPMEVVRAAVPAFIPYLERTWPKKVEHQTQTAITITLSTHQQAQMGALPLDVSATEVVPEADYEVLPDETAA